MQALMAEMKPGATFDYTANRNGKEREIRLAPAHMPEDAAHRIVGQHMPKGHATIEVASS